MKTDALSLLASSLIADGRGKKGALPAAIRRLTGTGTVAGRARTARCGPHSVAAMLAALAAAEAGDVLVVQGEPEWAAFGDVAGMEAERRGIAAIVVDGHIRDLAELKTMAFS